MAHLFDIFLFQAVLQLQKQRRQGRSPKAFSYLLWLCNRSTDLFSHLLFL